MVAKMAKQPIVFALANPTPEILPDEVRSVAPDAIIATGRSDFPNQVNNVLCFPFIFRGAPRCGGNRNQRRHADRLCRGYRGTRPRDHKRRGGGSLQGEQLTFGADYLIPKPFDPRLIGVVASSVARGGGGQWRRDAPAGGL